MGIFDKITFWKKDKETVLGDNAELPGIPSDIGGMPLREDPFAEAGMPSPQPQFQQPIPRQQMESFQEQKSFQQNRDMQLIVAKLDAIDAKLQNIEQRIAGLERVAYGEQQTSYSRRRW